MSLDCLPKGIYHQNLVPNINFTSANSDEEQDFGFAFRNERTSNFSMNLRQNYFVADNIGIVAGLHIQSSSTKREEMVFGTNDYIETSNSNSAYLIEVGGQYGHYFGNFPVMAEATVGFGSRHRSASRKVRMTR